MYFVKYKNNYKSINKILKINEILKFSLSFPNINY